MGILLFLWKTTKLCNLYSSYGYNLFKTFKWILRTRMYTCSFKFIRLVVKTLNIWYLINRLVILYMCVCDHILIDRFKVIANISRDVLVIVTSIYRLYLYRFDTFIYINTFSPVSGPGFLHFKMPGLNIKLSDWWVI